MATILGKYKITQEKDKLTIEIVSHSISSVIFSAVKEFFEDPLHKIEKHLENIKDEDERKLVNYILNGIRDHILARIGKKEDIKKSRLEKMKDSFISIFHTDYNVTDDESAKKVHSFLSHW